MSQLTKRGNIEHWKSRIAEALTGDRGPMPVTPEYALSCLDHLAALADELLSQTQRQRRELRRLNKPGHWAHLAVRVYERVAQEIDASLKKMGIELPLKVKN